MKTIGRQKKYEEILPILCSALVIESILFALKALKAFEHMYSTFINMISNERSERRATD